MRKSLKMIAAASATTRNCSNTFAIHCFRFALPLVAISSIFGTVRMNAMIESLLQMTEIKRCPTVELEFQKKGERRPIGPDGRIAPKRPRRANEGQLPVEAISNWFERSSNGMEDQKEKFLKICFYGYRCRVQNVQEMLSHLTKICFRAFFTFKYIFKSSLSIFFINARFLMNVE